MRNRTFLVWHLAYLTIIASLVGYSLHRYDRERQLRDFLHFTVLRAKKNVIDSRNRLYDRIQSMAGVFSSPANLETGKQAQEVDSLRKQFQYLVNSCIETSDAPDLRNTQRYVEAPLSAEKIRQLQEAADSLREKYRAFVDVRAIGTGLIKNASVDFPDWLPGYMKTANVKEMTAVLSSLHVQADLAEYFVLDHLATSISDGHDEANFEPVLLASNSALRTGDWYEASVFLSHRFAPDGLRIKVNRKNLPIENGAAHIRTRCDRAGISTFRVEIDLINPLDNTTKTYTRTYQVEVLPADSTKAGRK